MVELLHDTTIFVKLASCDHLLDPLGKFGEDDVIELGVTLLLDVSISSKLVLSKES